MDSFNTAVSYAGDYVNYASNYASQNPVVSVLAGLTVCSGLYYYATRDPNASLPIINPKGMFELSNKRVKQHFVKNGRQLLRQGFEKYGDKPFRVNTDHGLMVILPPKFVNEIRNIPELNHARAIASFVNSELPGMEPFQIFGYGGDIIQDVVKLRLTQALGSLTKELSDETSLMLVDAFTDNKEWHKMHVSSTLLRAVARVSSRVFLGERLCRDPEWLKITTGYTHAVAHTVGKLNAWPKMLRRFIYPYLPHTSQLLKVVKDARRVMGEVIEERRILKAKGEAPEYVDAIEWFEQVKNGRPYDPVHVQLTLSFVAIHTTADMVTQLMFDLAQHPELIQPLRDEIVSVLKEYGWKKASLYNMKLLDSVLKESQRVRPINATTIQRLADKPVTLSDGTRLTYNTLSVIPLNRHWDAEYYPDPEVFDGYRFLKMRQEPGKDNLAQFVSTSPDYLSFGHGLHACPGRFFASNEIKIIMCHILLKYEWRLLPDKTPNVLVHGFNLVADPFSSIEIRRRQEEINIDEIV